MFSPTELMALTRAEFPLLKRYTWLLSNARGPLPQRVARALRQMQTMLGADPLGAAVEFEQAAIRARRLTAFMLNAQPEEIAFFNNTTTAITAIAQALPFQPGDNVVIAAGEFPGLVYPWLALQPRGLTIRFAPLEQDGTRQITPSSIAATADQQTRAIILSHVDWVTGAKRDLPAIGAFCRAYNIYLIVDAAQSMGATPIDTQAMNITALACRGDKWLLAASGIACLYVRRAAQEQLAPGLLGYYGMDIDEEEAAQPDFAFPIRFKASAARYELGGPNELGLVAWGAALDWLLELGSHNIEQHTLRLSEIAASGIAKRGYKLLSPTAPNQHSSIVTFAAPNFEQVQEALWQENIMTGGDELNKIIQLAPHFFNNEADIARLLAALPLAGL